MYTARIFMKCTHVSAAQTTYLLFHQIINRTCSDFLCSADEIAEPRPEMIVKVAAFTVSEKNINTPDQNPIKIKKIIAIRKTKF